MIDYSESLNENQLKNIVQYVFNNLQDSLRAVKPINKNSESVIINANINTVFFFFANWRTRLLGNHIVKDITFNGDPKIPKNNLELTYLNKYRVKIIVEEVNSYIQKENEESEKEWNYKYTLEGQKSQSECLNCIFISCENATKTLVAVEEKFGKYLSSLKWINFGGGHHITREDYDVDRLIRCINYIQDKYNVEVYLEPGEACVLNAGYLVTRVLDTFKNGDKNIALVDCSAACHMPDVLECHFLPPLLNANLDNEGIRYKLGGPTCLSGDNIGEYIFKEELKENEILVFGDCALYTTCKTNTFNGMPLPNIYILHKDKSLEKLTDFNYFDFKNRLGKTK
jgi:hypothetical protein